jgi:hypothetical protein
VGGDGNDVSIKLSPGSLFPWHNDAKPGDVSGAFDNQGNPQPDGNVFPFDAQEVVNYLNTHRQDHDVPANAVLGLPFGFLDVVPNNFIEPFDALEIINILNAQPRGGKGESVVGTGAPAQRVDVPSPTSPPLSPDSDWLTLLALDLAQTQTISKKRS